MTNELTYTNFLCGSWAVFAAILRLCRMKKRWTFELIIDTELHNDEWSEKIEEMSVDEATKTIKQDLEYMLENYPYELELLKVEARNAE